MNSPPIWIGAPSGVPMPMVKMRMPCSAARSAASMAPESCPSCGGISLFRKGHGGQREGLTDVGALHRNHRRGYSAGKGFGHAVVRGDRQLHYGVAREDDQSHAILLESVEELVDGVFGAFEAVGLEILGEHRVRNIDHEHHLDTPALHLAEFRTQLRPCERQGEQGECREVQDEFQTPAPRRSVGHERTDGFEPAETAEAPACELSGGRPYGDEQREEPQQPEVFGICESEHYGRDFNQRVRNRNSTSSRARAAAAQRRYSSV